ncbi:Lrp/AsnC family transcriptional regulator [Nonomuraea roseoviolacea subsp. roseoviolacea]|uniref:DNA-binding Lrp family transcriptional regulator n=1 Tax=Nonomuraea roseoviolacea subsp. carminata TaxID=160689 RepID=A0ABT1KD31_9ACTN|nr:Lrp/AsnC family transcriptional regulator [Nonomuraea roseoviolacea]MCP2351291.1 DNA-binding Lrp family transcriptional regulator [Nonomuraea roseoviolacea subsp. carminata]
MDAIDRAIISELERDGRLTNVELAHRVGLTPGPCLRRVQRLEAEGVIRGYRAVVDPAAVGRSFEVLVDLTLDSQDAETVAYFEQTLARAEEVLELRRLFGSPDYFARVAVADLAAYETFLSRYVMTIPRVRNINSHFTMKDIKPGREAR